MYGPMILFLIVISDTHSFTPPSPKLTGIRILECRLHGYGNEVNGLSAYMAFVRMDQYSYS